MPTVRGREEIAAFFSSLLSPFEGTMHTVGNIQLQWEGEGRIRSRSYFQAYHWLSSTGPDPQRPADLISTGVYLDDFRLTPDGWRINSRQRRNVGPSPVGVGRLPARLQGLGGAAQPDQL
ncbi:MAG: nuclear transport factor 2 family protein [Nocardioidaceae bacterium]|nr:MAG: nuclear transport factor 2 family protein [Nocardioidaceae bacterium]